MDTDIFDRMTQGISSSGRRRMLGAGTAGVLAVFGGRLITTEAEAKK